MKKAIYIFGTILTLGLAACGPVEQSDTVDTPQTEIGVGVANDDAVATDDGDAGVKSEDGSEGAETATEPTE